MAPMVMLKAWGIALTACFALDLVWLGLVARGFYRDQFAELMRPDVQWAPAVLFYALYVAMLIVVVVAPSVERQALGRAIGHGALVGFAAYAAFDLTGLALLRDFPVKAALVDLVWGASLSATVSAVGYWAMVRMA